MDLRCDGGEWTMNQIGNDGAEHAAEYIEAVRGTWPLVSLAGAIALASALHQLKRGYKQRTTAQKVVTVLLNAVLTTSLAVGCVILLPLAVPDVTPEMQIAGAVILAGIGGETVKQWILKRLGLSVVDLTNSDDINNIRKGMDAAMRKKHAAQCPFREDECADVVAKK